MMTFAGADRTDVLSSGYENGVLSHHGAHLDGCSDDHNSGTGSAGFGVVPDFRNQESVWLFGCPVG
jgi:hypothetical protein